MVFSKAIKTDKNIHPSCVIYKGTVHVMKPIQERLYAML